jgi:molybdopterin-guanine dinucleotide biosynthesis protein B
MKIVGIIGPSGSGKTSLIRRLVPELKKRKIKVAVIKHCPHGFDLEREGKDSWRFAEAGAQAVAMVSRDRLAVSYRERQKRDWKALAERFFPGVDLVIVEGGRNLKGIRTIEIVEGLAASGARKRDPCRVALIVSSGQGVSRIPAADIKALARFLETKLPDEAPAGKSRSHRRS